MIYLVCYLFIGLLLVVFKTPFHELVKKSVRDLKLSAKVNNKELKGAKLWLVYLIFSMVVLVGYPFMAIPLYKKNRLHEKILKERKAQMEEDDKLVLQGQLSVKEAEAKYTSGDEISFGSLHDKWGVLLGNMQDGDELYEFKTMSGEYEGIALIRHGNIVVHSIFITMIACG